jgi:MFS family permease
MFRDGVVFQLLFTNRQIQRLFLAQALFWSCAMTGIILTSLAGLHLASRPALATVPMGLLVVGNLLAVRPLSGLMQRRGRKAGFLIGALSGLVGGLSMATAVWAESFALLCLGAVPLGVYQASAMFYRFAALESVEDSHKGRAAACVIGGGVLAAVLAPGLSAWANTLLSIPFVGAYLMVAGLAGLAVLLLSGLAVPSVGAAAGEAVKVGARALLSRPIIRAAILTTAIGHGLMVLIMTATPLAMHGHGMGVELSAQVIQWHVLGMFLPAFLAGPLVDRLGSVRVACIGAAIMAVSGSTALMGTSHLHFLISSCLLGAGWNLLLVSGTTLLGAGHSNAERGSAQGLMELSNGAMAALMSFASGLLLANAGWLAVNAGLLPLIAWVVLVQVGIARRRMRSPPGSI